MKLQIPKDFYNDALLNNIKKNKAELIDFVENSKSKNNKLKEIPRSNKKSSRLTPNQLRMFLAEGMTKGTNTYNIPFIYELRGALDINRLEKAFITLIQRHESLRTSFYLDENHEPIQKVEEDFDFSIDCSSSSEEELEKIKQDFSTSFDLGQAPLIRAKLLDFGEDVFVLLVDIHHIVFDGISMKIFMKELSAVYNNEELPELQLSYIDYADWFYGDENESQLNAQKSFWLEQFKGYSNTAMLPSDFKRELGLSSEGAYSKFSISGKRIHVLRQIAKRYEVSLFSMLISIYSILESKLTGVNDLSIGTPVAGRRHWSIENIVGMFVNTLAIRVFTTGDLKFSDYLSQVSKIVNQSFDHQEYSYETLLEDLGVRSESQNNALFNTLLSLANFTENVDFGIGDVNFWPLEYEKSTAKFDLILHFEEKGDEILSTFEYNSRLFTEGTIARFFEYFINIIDQIGIDESISLDNIHLLDQDSCKALVELNDFSEIVFPNEVTLIELFEDRVAKAPDRVALIYGEATMTYGELNQQANKVARVLRSKGVERDDVIGILMEKNMQVVISMLGILKAGGAYVPIDVTYPQDRIDYIIENSQLQLMLTSDEYAGLVQNEAVTLVSLDEAKSISDTTNLPGINRPEDLCYIIYTSGTTGNPKGVMVEHKNVVRLLFNEAFQFDFTADDVWTMFHSHCFDFSVWEMYGPLLYGGKLVLVSQDEARDPSRYLQMVQTHQVTVLNQTPTAFYSLSKTCEDHGVELPAVRYVIFGGEALSPIKLKRWKASHPQTKMVNMYGITEITVHASYKEIEDFEIENNLGNIGKSIPTGSLFLLDSNQKPVPTGVIGELYVGGEGVARGYINNPKLTDSRFVNNPFKHGTRLYRTGDLAVLLDNGDFEYKGRIDRQVQLKGFRIELKEIEHQLNRHESIDDVVVVKTQSASTEEPFLCAYYLGEDELNMTELRSFLQDKLPGYMIPSYYVRIEEMPFTSNNKIDTARLPEPIIGLTGSSYVAPSTEEEVAMCEIWQEHLGVDRIGVSDNFFVLGGDSLKAIGLISRLNERLATSLTIADLYANSSIIELVDAIQSKGDSQTEQLIQEIEQELVQFEENYRQQHDCPDNYEAIYPMTGIEKGMVYYSLMDSSDNIQNIMYHEQNFYSLSIKDFDVQVFKRALKLVTKKHEEFRKIYDLNNWVHIILNEIEPDLEFIDIMHLNAEEQQAFIAKKCEEEKLKQTNLSMSLIWRMHLIKVREDYHYLLFDFNHSLIDGWSLSVFLRDLNNAYHGLVKGPDYIPTPIAAGYKDQILAEMVASRNELSKAYWRENLEGYKRFELQPTGQSKEIITSNYDLGREFRKELEAASEKLAVSFKHLCYAGLIYALKRFTYERDLTIGVVSNTRPLVSDGEELVGCFLNTVPFRIEIPKESSWKDYIQNVDDGLIDLKSHEIVPFYRILEFIDEKSDKENPIFDVKLNYIDFRPYDQFENVEGGYIGKINDDFKAYLNENTPLNLTIYAQSGGFILNLIYSTAFWGNEAADKLFDYLKNTFEQILKDVNGNHSCNSILPQQEYKKVSEQFNDTSAAYEKNTTVLDLFKEQVQIAPDNLAVTYENESLTYEELDQLSNQLANKLVEMGVEAETLVPIAVDRSVEMMVGILAVLKAGGAYVPIDPTYARKRIDYILDDIQSPFILTQSSYENTFEIEKLYLDVASTYDGAKKSAPNIEVSDTSLAYVIYTSGTTGKPKGVMNGHQGIYNRLVWMRDHFKVNDEDSILQKTSFCFDVSVWELLLPIISGARLVFAKPEGHKDPNYISEVIDKENITLMHFVPSMLTLFLASIEGVEASKLRCVICSGEELKLATTKDFKLKLPAVELHNLYGPTEAAIDVTAINISSYDKQMVPIGKPIANVQLYIVNDQNELQPVGVKGELLIGGVQVAKGYLNKPELTAEKFIQNPFNPDSNFKLYRTGDFARWLPDGNIEFLGRIDNQIKLRGNRIELGEIEYHLSSHDAIDTAIALLKEINGVPSIVAYYLAKQEAPLEIEVLQEFLLERMPAYMIPAYFVKLEELPLSSNGKLQTSALPTPEVVRLASHVDPDNETEEHLVAIWSEILGIEREKISVTTSFFNIGGNSLNSMSLSNAISKEFAVDMVLSEVFAKQTIRALSEYILTIQQLQAIVMDEEEEVALLI